MSFLKPVVAKNGSNGSLPAAMSFIQVDSANVIVDTLKAAEDGNGFILRVYESTGCRQNVTIGIALNINEVSECNLVEVDKNMVEFKNGSMTFYIKPFEIKTFRLK